MQPQYVKLSQVGVLWESPGESTEHCWKSLWPGEEVTCSVTQQVGDRAKSGIRVDYYSRFSLLQNQTPEIELCLSSSLLALPSPLRPLPPKIPLHSSSQIIFLRDSSNDMSLPFKTPLLTHLHLTFKALAFWLQPDPQAHLLPFLPSCGYFVSSCSILKLFPFPGHRASAPS